MIVEFQLSSEILGRIIRNRIHQLALCVEKPLPLPIEAMIDVLSA